MSAEQPMGEGAGASVHDWMFSGKSDAEAERFERDHFANTGAVSDEFRRQAGSKLAF